MGLRFGRNGTFNGMYFELLERAERGEEKFTQEELELLIPKVSYFAKEGKLNAVKAILAVVPERTDEDLKYRHALQSACKWYQVDVIRGLKKDFHDLAERIGKSKEDYANFFLGTSAVEPFFGPVEAGRLDIAKEIVDFVTLDGKYPEACEGLLEFLSIHLSRAVHENRKDELEKFLKVFDLLPERKETEKKVFWGDWFFVESDGKFLSGFEFMAENGRTECATLILDMLKSEEVRRSALEPWRGILGEGLSLEAMEKSLKEIPLVLSEDSVSDESDKWKNKFSERTKIENPEEFFREKSPLPELYDEILPHIEREIRLSKSSFLPLSASAEVMEREILRYRQEAANAARCLTLFFDNRKDVEAYVRNEALHIAKGKSGLEYPCGDLSRFQYLKAEKELSEQWDKKLWAPLIRDYGFFNVGRMFEKAEAIERFLKKEKRTFPKTLEELEQVSKDLPPTNIVKSGNILVERGTGRDRTK